MTTPRTSAQRALRLVVPSPSRPVAAPAVPVADPHRDAPTALRLFWYPLDSRDEEIRGHLIGAAHRLGCAIDELRADARRRDLSHALEAFEYHLENLAIRLFELREVLLDLVDLARRRSAVDVARVGRILAQMDEEIPLRDARERKVFLHLNVRVGQRLYDPRPAVRALGSTTARGRAGHRGVRAALQAAIDAYAARASAILEAIPGLLDAVDV